MKRKDFLSTGAFGALVTLFLGYATQCQLTLCTAASCILWLVFLSRKSTGIRMDKLKHKALKTVLKLKSTISIYLKSQV
ncbi:hypothetical protein [Winogradskyella sp.]|uniref:hypothetical protein n=1 Tax=Winogradskyella sp. TaxID=1883156 RepID=UPI002601DC8D|nr:hypothetical protein [Winogradskyella sp.]